MAPMARGLHALAVLALCFVAACNPQYRNHGYVPPEDNLARIDIGDSRQEVATLVGHPSATGLLQDDAWFYVRSRYRDHVWRAPVEIDREVVAITFTGESVANIERFGLRQGRVVPLSRRVTDPNVTGVPFLRQIFGNIGQFNPADFFNEE